NTLPAGSSLVEEEGGPMRRLAGSGIALVLVLSSALMAGSPSALAAQTRRPVRKRSFAQRHPVVTSVAAGVAAHHVAKKTGRRRTATGRRRNFAQRHPVATGVAAAAATHHVIRRSHH